MNNEAILLILIGISVLSTFTNVALESNDFERTIMETKCIKNC